MRIERKKDAEFIKKIINWPLHRLCALKVSQRNVVLARSNLSPEEKEAVKQV